MEQYFSEINTIITTTIFYKCGKQSFVHYKQKYIVSSSIYRKKLNLADEYLLNQKETVVVNVEIGSISFRVPLVVKKIKFKRLIFYFFPNLINTIRLALDTR